MGIADRLAGMNAAKATENLEKGESFLQENGKRPEVTTTASGLQYEVLEQGNGEKPLASHTVTCHYHGTLLDGTVFDSSVQRGRPASFPLNAVIKGWTEGLQYMPKGSKYRFFIHPNLGYGNRQVSREIGPNTTLIFDVELIDFN